MPLDVQVDLLAETWSRHRSPEQFEATLLDAAIVYACLMTAGEISEKDTEHIEDLFDKR